MSYIKSIIEKSNCKNDKEFASLLATLQTDEAKAKELAEKLTTEEIALLAHAVRSLRGVRSG